MYKNYPTSDLVSVEFFQNFKKKFKIDKESEYKNNLLYN